MSCNITAALEPEDSPMYVEDFDEQIDKMKMLHQRWRPLSELISLYKFIRRTLFKTYF